MGERDSVALLAPAYSGRAGRITPTSKFVPWVDGCALPWLAGSLFFYFLFFFQNSQKNAANVF
jgi:hypothetical protein